MQIAYSSITARRKANLNIGNIPSKTAKVRTCLYKRFDRSIRVSRLSISAVGKFSICVKERDTNRARIRKFNAEK